MSYRSHRIGWVKAAGAAAVLVFLACEGDSSPTDPPPPTLSIFKAAGDAQEAVAGGELAELLVVRVTEDGAPAPGRGVTWRVVTGDASLLEYDDATGADGLARARVGVGETAGEVRVQASVLQVGAVEFTAMALPGPPERARIASGFVALSVDEVLPVAVRVTDAFGNEIDNAEVGLETRDADVVAVTDGSVRGRQLGAAVVVARVASTADSTVVAVLGEDQAAVALVGADGRAFPEAAPEADIELRLVAVSPERAGLAALQGRVSWTGGATFAAADEAGDGYAWQANAAEAAADGTLRFAAWRAAAAAGPVTLGRVTLRAPPDASHGALAVDVEIAGDDLGRGVTDRVVPVATALVVPPEVEP